MPEEFVLIERCRSGDSLEYRAPTARGVLLLLKSLDAYYGLVDPAPSTPRRVRAAKKGKVS